MKKIKYSILVILILLITGGVAQTYNFDTCGSSGRYGPSQSQCDTSYSGTNLDNEVDVVGQGVQVWTVPRSGKYRITAAGASGRGSHPGDGAVITGEVSLDAGQKLRMLVGQQGQSGNLAKGGGGASFVVKETSSGSTMPDGQSVSPIVIAGGGGAALQSNNNQDANLGDQGSDGFPDCYQNNCDAGSTGYGAVDSGGCGSAGGGGGYNNGHGGESGSGFLSGWAVGGQDGGCNNQIAGGFGGGGGAANNGGTWGGSGGGGGYTGGGHGSFDSSDQDGYSGGGGSFKDSGFSVTSQSVSNSGSGYVTIENANSPPEYSNPDPATSTGTSPVFTTSPQLNLDIVDPNGGDLDLTFYSNSGSPNLNLQQGGNSWQIDPYESSESGQSFYPGPVAGSSDFLLSVHRDTSTGTESVIFGTEADSNMNAQLDLKSVPSGSTVTRSDDNDGAGNPRHNRDELSLSHEPEGDWGWGTCCTDGAVLQLGPSWNDLVIDPDTDLSVGPDFRFYQSNGNKIDLDKSQEITIVSDDLEVIESKSGVSPGDISAEWSGLERGKTYDWYVRACDERGACSTSPTWTFEVSGGPEEPDNPDPSDGELIYAPSGNVDLSARYMHEGGLGPGTLTFHDGSGSEIGSCEAQHGNRCSVPMTVSNGNQYEWTVEAEFNGQTVVSDTWTFTTNTPPEEPSSPNPNDGTEELDYNSVTLSSYVEDQDGDDMQVTFSGDSGTDSFSKTTSVSGSGTASVTVDNLQPGTHYDWDVAVEDEHGASSTSDTWSFTTNYLPTIEDPQPQNGGLVSSDSVELNIDVSDDDGDMTNVRIYDDSGAQIGSGSTSDGSQVTVDADYTGLTYGETYDWTVEAEDAYGTNSRTFSFSVIGGGSFRTESGIDYEYSSVVKSGGQTRFVEYEVTNRNVNDKELETSISGPEATFSQYSGSSHTYALGGGETKNFRIQITEPQPGDYDMEVTTQNLDLGVENTDSIPVLVREYPASGVERVPGIGLLQIMTLLGTALLITVFGSV